MGGEKEKQWQGHRWLREQRESPETIKKERKETVAVRCQAPYKAKMPKKRPPSQQPKETCAHRWVRQSTLSSCLSLLLLPQHIMRCAIARQSPTELNLKWRIKIPESFLQTTWAGTFWASRQTQRQWDVQWEGLWDVQWRQAADSGSDKCSTQCSAPCDENSSTVRIALYIEIVKNHRVLGAVSGAWLGLMAKRDERRQREVARCQRKRRRWRLPRRVKANFRWRRLLSHVFHYTLHTVLPSLSLSLPCHSRPSPLSFSIVVSITACPARDISHIDDIQLIEPVWSMMKALAVFLFIFSSAFLSIFFSSFTSHTLPPFAVVFCVYKITMLKIKSSARNETSAKTHNTQQIIEQHFIYLPYLCVFVWKYIYAG